MVMTLFFIHYSIIVCPIPIEHCAQTFHFSDQMMTCDDISSVSRLKHSEWLSSCMVFIVIPNSSLSKPNCYSLEHYVMSISNYLMTVVMCHHSLSGTGRTGTGTPTHTYPHKTTLHCSLVLCSIVSVCQCVLSIVSVICHSFISLSLWQLLNVTN